MRVDAHHHVLDPGRRTYPWMTPDLAPIDRPWSVDELRPLLDAQELDATVLVQTVPATEETVELLGLAAADEWIAGVVGWVDLEAPDVDDQVARLRAAPGGSALVGVRHNLHDEADPRWITRPAVLRSLGRLAEQGLAFDLLVRQRELPAAIEAADAVPELAFVLDHVAKPSLADGELAAWAPLVGELAARPNVTCKLSGLVTEASWATWVLDDLRGAVDHALATFGPDRLMYGSDWPVCTLAADYATVHDAAVALTDAGDRDAIFGATARRVYRLDR